MGLLAGRYARALFDYAADLQQTAVLKVEMGRIPEAFLLYPDLQTVLENPVVEPEEKCKLILTAAQADKNSLLNQFLIFLTEKRRLTYINRIALQYLEIYNKEFNIHNMTITTAYDADKETIGQLQNWIQKELKGSVNVRHQKDVSIIGGFIADVDFNRWDASVRTQLSEIKRKLS
jgi:F-type H+-transporting ATPase subunit delta